MIYQHTSQSLLNEFSERICRNKNWKRWKKNDVLNIKLNTSWWIRLFINAKICSVIIIRIVFCIHISTWQIQISNTREMEISLVKGSKYNWKLTIEFVLYNGQDTSPHLNLLETYQIIILTTVQYWLIIVKFSSDRFSPLTRLLHFNQQSLKCCGNRLFSSIFTEHSSDASENHHYQSRNSSVAKF